MATLKLYYHLNPQPFWEQFTIERIDLMKSTGLWDAFDEIILCINYSDSIIEPLRTITDNDPRIRYVYSEDAVRPFGEQYTNRVLKKEVDSTNEHFFVCRVHNKGLNHYTGSDWPRNKILKDELDHNNIVRWQDCVKKLEFGYDAAGCNWVRQPWPHFKGNFWWATSDYIRKLKLLPPPHEMGFVQQIRGGGWTVHDAESWIGTADPRAYDILRETDQIGDHPDI